MKKFLVKQRCKLLLFITHKMALPAIKNIRKKSVFPLSIEELKRLPDASLGNDLYNFITTRNLQLLSHYARHDLKHIVLNYDTTEAGEYCLQSFMLGNGRVSFPVLATVGFGLLLAPEHWKKMYISFCKGRKSNNIHNWKWFEILHLPTAELRNKIYNYA